MSRYIDADKAKNGIMKFVNEYGEIVGMFVNDFNILLERCAVDVEPRWIPVTERLPEEPFRCLVTVWDTNPISMDDFENLLLYFVGWDGEQWNNDDGEQCPFEVIAWMPLPEPYKEQNKE